MSPITTHILDTSLGTPAQGVSVLLYSEKIEDPLASGITNEDGRVLDLLDPGTLEQGVYRIEFNTISYFQAKNIPTFFPKVVIYFEIVSTDQHYHVPLLISPYGYSTYRGS